MKVYLLDWSDFSREQETLGIASTREIAENWKAAFAAKGLYSASDLAVGEWELDVCEIRGYLR